MRLRMGMSLPGILLAMFLAPVQPFPDGEQDRYGEEDAENKQGERGEGFVHGITPFRPLMVTFSIWIYGREVNWGITRLIAP